MSFETQPKNCACFASLTASNCVCYGNFEVGLRLFFWGEEQFLAWLCCYSPARSLYLSKRAVWRVSYSAF